MSMLFYHIFKCIYMSRNVEQNNVLTLIFISLNSAIIKIYHKHCQRHNGPRVLSPYLEKSFSVKKNSNLFQSYPDGATCIGCKFGDQMALLAMVVNLATRWHYLHWL